MVVLLRAIGAIVRLVQRRSTLEGPQGLAEARTETPALMIDELRRQVDHQIDAAKSLDTRATALLAGLATIATLLVPRIGLNSCAQAVAAVLAAICLLLTFGFLALAVRPQKRGFSYGPDPAALAEHIDQDRTWVEKAMVASLVEVRNRNEAVLSAKGGWLIKGLVGLVATVVALGILVVVGGVQTP